MPAVRLDSLLAVAAHRRAQGDEVEERGDVVIAKRSIERYPTVGEVRWDAERGVVLIVGPSPLEVPEHAVSQIILEVMRINSRVPSPGFVLRKLPEGWRLFFHGMAFLDEDGTISAHGLERLLDYVRSAAMRHLPELAAIVAAAAPPATTRALANYRRKNPMFTKDEMASLRDAITRDCPDFLPRTRNAMVAEIEQPFFTQTRIIEILSPDPLPARAIFVAMDVARRSEVLSRRASEIVKLVAREPIAETQRDAFKSFVQVVVADDRGSA